MCLPSTLSMRKRLLVAGIGLALLGVYLLLVPIASGPGITVDLPSGESAQVAVPWSASVAGGAVYVQLSAGTTPVLCRGYCPNEPYHPPFVVDVFDCGPSACEPGQNYSYVGTVAIYGYTVADFPAIPNHYYQLWAWTPGWNQTNLSLPLTYSIHGPVLGGAVGIAGMASGAAAVVVAVLDPRYLRKAVNLPSSGF